MKKILLSSVIIVLVAGFIGGGLFADFSDIETSEDNVFSTGSMDLKVSNYLGDEFDDPDVPTFFMQSNACPGCSKDKRFDLHNDGQGDQVIPKAYIHIKNLECYGIEKTEPELAAEMAATPIGEKADGTPVYATDDGTATGTPLIGGDLGENCELAEHVDIAMFTGPTSAGPWTAVDLSGFDKNLNGIIKVDEVVCEQIFVGELPPSVTLWVMISLMLQDIDEDDLGFHLFDETTVEAKWDHWPTNALMKDGMRFDIAFELLQN